MKKLEVWTEKERESGKAEETESAPPVRRSSCRYNYNESSKLRMNAVHQTTYDQWPLTMYNLYI